jgi:hypothetical protein
MTTRKGRDGKNWLDDMQESFFWSGVVFFVLIFALDIGFIKESFGIYILLAKAVNSGACYICFGIGSRKTLQMGGQFFKFFALIKKGVDPVNEEESDIELPERGETNE